MWISDAGLKRAARSSLKIQDAKSRHLGTVTQLCPAISSQLRHVSTIRKKNLLSSNTSSICPHNMANFGPLTAEIGWTVCTTRHLVVGVSQTYVEQRAPPIFGRATITLDVLFPELEMIRKFAQLEFRHGSVERGKTLFENLVTTYPRRTDIWSVYIDVCVKFGDISQARWHICQSDLLVSEFTTNSCKCVTVVCTSVRLSHKCFKNTEMGING